MLRHWLQRSMILLMEEGSRNLKQDDDGRPGDLSNVMDRAYTDCEKCNQLLRFSS